MGRYLRLLLIVVGATLVIAGSLASGESPGSARWPAIRGALAALDSDSVLVPEATQLALELRALPHLLAGPPYYGSVSRDEWKTPEFTLGLDVDCNDGRVRAVHPLGPAYFSGIRLGDSILCINSRSLTEIVSGDGLRRCLNSDEERDVTLVWLDDRGAVRSGKMFLAQGSSLTTPSVAEVRSASSTIQYIRVAALATERDGAELASQVLSSRSAVIDLRRCTSSGMQGVVAFASRFGPPGAKICDIVSPNGESKAVVAVECSESARGIRVMLLVSQFTSGSQELLIPFLAKHAGAVTIGSRTAGRLALLRAHELPGAYFFLAAHDRLVDCNGTSALGLGYAPDVVDGATIRGQYPDVGFKHDLQIRRAVDLLGR